MPDDQFHSNSSEPSLLQRVERALLLLAYFIEIDGDIHVALYERLENELRELQRKEETKDRARHLLLSYGQNGPSNAMRARNLGLSSSEGPRPYTLVRL